MKHYILFALCVMWTAVSGQETQQISTGNGYNWQSYSSLETGMEKKVANNAWDIAFNVWPGEAGIFINESVNSSVGATAIEAFYTLSEDFSEVPDTSVYLQFPLMNVEKTWSYGALNEIRNPDDTNDYGWGIYNPGTQEINGSNVYVIQLRNGTKLKLQVQSLIADVYTFRYANLDGSNEISRTIAKGDHAGKLMAYYSFATDDVVDVEPADGFDLLFCRYTALLDDPNGGEPIPYLVTGVLSGGGVEVAQADGVDPQTVMLADYQDQFSDDIETIGHDWKYFDLGNFAWIITENLVYFVKTANDRVWKVHFTAFGGSGTGTATFEKTDLGILSAVDDPYGSRDQIKVYPNPATSDLQVLFEMQSAPEHSVLLQLMSADGSVITEQQRAAVSGLNALTLNVANVPTGMYYVRIQADNQTAVQKISVVR